MKPQKPSIFALARTAPTHTPLRELLLELESFRPPTKTPELLAIEQARLAAGQERDRADKACQQMCLIARNQDNGEAQHTRVTAADILTAQRLVVDCDSRMIAAREAEERASLEWRRAYTTEVFNLVAPARVALHELVDEIQAAMTLFRTLANRTASASVGSPWICREAETIIAHLRAVRDHLKTDREIS